MTTQVEIDGSSGEGGGQVLRTALSLSVLTGQPFRIDHIRARRANPGLQPQHLAAVHAAAAISQAEIIGAEVGSQFLKFHPGNLRPGNYRFDIKTAGSTSLVLQTILIPLSLADGSSSITLTGGTHVPWSPSFHYLALHWLPFIQQMGGRIRLTLENAGYYPQGGGKVEALIRPASGLLPIHLVERGALVEINGISGVSNLDLNIATRQKHQALRRLELICRHTHIKSQEVPAFGKGTFLLVVAEFEKTRAAYCALGARGLRAERVADEACEPLEKLIAGPAAVDEYLADQLLLPMAFAKGESQVYTARITGHLLINADILRKFLSVNILIQGDLDQPGLVIVNYKESQFLL